MLVNKAFRPLIAVPVGALGSEGTHGGRVAAGFGGDVPAVAQGVQPLPYPGRAGLCELGDGAQDGADVVGDIEFTNRRRSDAPETDAEVGQGFGDVFGQVAGYSPPRNTARR